MEIFLIRRIKYLSAYKIILKAIENVHDSRVDTSNLKIAVKLLPGKLFSKKVISVVLHDT